eukprot:1148082-Pelagomonas_calceolata.AAC.2
MGNKCAHAPPASTNTPAQYSVLQLRSQPTSQQLCARLGPENATSKEKEAASAQTPSRHKAWVQAASLNTPIMHGEYT